MCSYYRGPLYNLLKLDRKENLKKGTAKPKVAGAKKSQPSKPTAEILCDKTGVPYPRIRTSEAQERLGLKSGHWMSA